MWATLNKENQVTGWIVAVPYEEALILAEDDTLVEMTIENSPATVGYFYNGKNFYKKED
jgi:hypothetical protein